jgi:hypothetical protein
MSLADDIGRLVHAFADKGRKDAVRALAKRADILESFARDEAERDCAYGDGCPENAGTRHGTCLSCRATIALGKSAEIALRAL